MRSTTRRRWHLVAVIALMVVAFPELATAQQVDARLRARLSRGALKAVDAVVDSAKTAGLPTEPLIQKALQGAAKGASGDRIVHAVRRLATDLRSARQALGSRASAVELEAGASAVRAGISSRELAQLRKARPQQPLAIALAMVSDLVARGVPADVALSTVRSLVQRGAPDDELLRMQREVERDIRAGVPAAIAASIRGGGPGTSPRPTAGGVDGIGETRPGNKRGGGKR